MRALLLLLPLVFSCFNRASQKNNVDSTRPFTVSTACLFSQIAYCHTPQQQLDHFLPGWKMVWQPTAVNGNYAFVATDGYAYAVAIRGSLMEFSRDAFQNWIYHDINIIVQQDWPYSKIPGAKVSQGSYTAWQNLCKLTDKYSYETLLAFLQRNVTENTPVLFTGHSLGGNLSAVYASYFASEWSKKGKEPPPVNVMTFAAPAAGNEAFAKDFNTRFPESVRIENQNDIVARFPCAQRVSDIGNIYMPGIDAGKINVGYQNMSIPLLSMFKAMGTAISVLEWKSGGSQFTQTNSSGTVIRVKLSGKNKTHDLRSWLAEAGYQHGIAQYASILGVPVVHCNTPR